jgi:hypothetical protein
MTMHRLLTLLLVCLSCAGANAQTTTVISADKTTLTPGATVNATVTVSNTAIATPPISLTATASWSDYAGVAYTASAKPLILTVVRSITVSKVSIPIPASLSYDGTSVVADVPVTVTVAAGIASFAFSKVLAEGQTFTMTLPMVAK